MKILLTTIFILAASLVFAVSDTTLETIRRDYCDLCHKYCRNTKSLCKIKFDESGEDIEKLECECKKKEEE